MQKEQFIIMLTGYPVTGKTTTTQRVHTQFLDIYNDVELLSTLSIRHSLGLMNELYSDEIRDKVYQRMSELVEYQLVNKTRIVILDGNFSKAHRRETIYQLAAQHGAGVVIVNCVVDKDSVIAERLNYRNQHQDEIQHKAASLDLYHMIKNSSDPITNDRLPDGRTPIILEYETELQQINQKTDSSLSQAERELVDHIKNCLVPKEKLRTVKAIIFDIGGVIQNLRWETVTNQLVDVKSDLTMDRFRSAFYYRKEQYFGLYEVSKMSNAEFWSMVAGRLDMQKTDASRLSMALSCLYGPVDGELMEIIYELRKKYSLFILSNSCPELKKCVEANREFYKIFDEIYYSFEIGLKKPDRRSYEFVLERNNLLPEECVFIDDTTVNINTAEELGMKGILYHYSKKLMKDLENIL